MVTAPTPLRLRATLALLALPLAGCGDSIPSPGTLRPVKGRVVFSKPEALAGLKVQFVPRSPSALPASGDVAADGSFTLKSAQGDGIAEGDYGVRLDKPGGLVRGRVNSPIPQEYFDEDGGALRASIKPDTSELPPFELKPVAGAAGKGR